MPELSIYSIYGDTIKLPVDIKPKARNNQVLGIINSRLKIAIAATAVDNQANKALIAFISKLLSIKKQEIVIARGLTNHLKVLLLPSHALAKLNAIIKDIGVSTAVAVD